MSNFIVLAFLIGFIAGLRSLTAPAVVSWAARLGWIHLGNSPLAFLGAAITPGFSLFWRLPNWLPISFPPRPAANRRPALLRAF
jgi:hypothetical protein